MITGRIAGMLLGALALGAGIAPGAQAQDEQALQPLTISTGGTSGLYYNYARTLARLMPRPKNCA